MDRKENKWHSILWPHYEETRELPGERDNARNNARCKIFAHNSTIPTLDTFEMKGLRKMHGQKRKQMGGFLTKLE